MLSATGDPAGLPTPQTPQTKYRSIDTLGMALLFFSWQLWEAIDFLGVCLTLRSSSTFS